MKFTGNDGKAWPETFDGSAWADAFLAQMQKTPEMATDHGTMLGWFANAIMRGYDHHAQETEAKGNVISEFFPDRIQ